jgi:hypothetical protein
MGRPVRSSHSKHCFGGVKTSGGRNWSEGDRLEPATLEVLVDLLGFTVSRKTVKRMSIVTADLRSFRAQRSNADFGDGVGDSFQSYRMRRSDVKQQEDNLADDLHSLNSTFPNINDQRD